MSWSKQSLTTRRPCFKSSGTSSTRRRSRFASSRRLWLRLPSVATAQHHRSRRRQQRSRRPGDQLSLGPQRGRRGRRMLKKQPEATKTKLWRTTLSNKSQKTQTQAIPARIRRRQPTMTTRSQLNPHVTRPKTTTTASGKKRLPKRKPKPLLRRREGCLSQTGRRLRPLRLSRTLILTMSYDAGACTSPG